MRGHVEPSAIGLQRFPRDTSLIGKRTVGDGIGDWSVTLRGCCVVTPFAADRLHKETPWRSIGSQGVPCVVRHLSSRAFPFGKGATRLTGLPDSAVIVIVIVMVMVSALAGVRRLLVVVSVMLESVIAGRRSLSDEISRALAAVATAARLGARRHNRSRQYGCAGENHSFLHYGSPKRNSSQLRGH
ncbi:hypothetical protein WOA01_14585 [Methylocystis sp. IM2]|uniref:hypothetical protein n=1 Tax=Methylocystis sp. IM2 TaxID=3136563 RepID=UPI0030FC17C4